MGKTASEMVAEAKAADKGGITRHINYKFFRNQPGKESGNDAEKLQT